jgi:hypothetical protein
MTILVKIIPSIALAGRRKESLFGDPYSNNQDKNPRFSELGVSSRTSPVWPLINSEQRLCCPLKWAIHTGTKMSWNDWINKFIELIRKSLTGLVSSRLIIFRTLSRACQRALSEASESETW